MVGSLKIGNRAVGHGYPTFILAEVGLAHDGSLNLAYAFVDAIARAGSDGVKFQTHIAEAESTSHETFRVPFSRPDGSRFDYWKRTAFTPAEWRQLADYSRSQGLLFLSSPFSEAAVDLLETAGVPAYKIASGEIRNGPLMDRVVETGKPMILSSGLSSLDDLDAAVAYLRQVDRDFAVLQCTTLYPCPPEQIGLGMLSTFRQRYDCPVGLSDHSGKVYAGLAAAALGASLLEVHVTLSRSMPGPDVPSSLTPDELSFLVQGVREVERMLAAEYDKDAVAQQLLTTRQLFSHSVVAVRQIPKGTVLERKDLASKKPGTGIPASRMAEVVGRRTRRELRRDQLIAEDDLEQGVR